MERDVHMDLSDGVFLITGAIDAGSPAEESGLKAGDLIYSFGGLNKGKMACEKYGLAVNNMF